MTDREGNEYLARVVRGLGRERVICIISPARQAKKARGLSGRQERKWRKAQRWVAHPIEQRVAA